MRSRISIPWVNHDDPLPPAASAVAEGLPYAGLVAAGQDLSTRRLLEAYRQGIFPWYSEQQPVLWWSPSPRMVLSIDQFKLHPSFKKTLKKLTQKSQCHIRFDSQFNQVITHCATRPRKGQNGTWIVPAMIEAYEQWHREGFVHSVETWIDDQLVGGLYCINIGHCLFGESMFSLQPDASKIALAALVCFAKAHSLPWIDCQQNTPHLASLGAKEMPRATFIEWVSQGRDLATPDWQFDPIYWDYLLNPGQSI